MSEANLWTRTRNKLGPFGKLVRVENSCELGTPDVAYCLGRTSKPVSGWLELKHVPEWPKKEHTSLVIKELTIDQVTWHEEWKKAGGLVFTLIQVDDDIMLVNTKTLRRIFERSLSRADLVGEALVFSTRQFPVVNILQRLIGTP